MKNKLNILKEAFLRSIVVTIFVVAFLIAVTTV